MNEQRELHVIEREQLARIEERIRLLLVGLMRDFRLAVVDHGLVLRGHSNSYYAKQLAQQAVMEISPLPIRANDIEVS
jgi:hypothetical protein